MPDYSYKLRHRPEIEIVRRRKKTARRKVRLRPKRAFHKSAARTYAKKHRPPIKRKNVQVTRIKPPNNEPSVAVNPLNEKVIITGYNADIFPLGFSRSKDGGRSYTNRLLPLPKGFRIASDAVAGSGFPSRKSGKGLFLIGGLASNRGKDGTVIVYRSANNGKTFSAPIIVNRGFGNKIFNDKPALAIDKSPASPYLGNAYISFTRFFNDSEGTVIFFQRSLDEGKTWSVPVRISDVKIGFPFVQGSSIDVGLTGEIFTAWIDFEEKASFFRMSRSDDGGATFGPIVTVAQIDPILDPLPVPGWRFRVLTFANIRADVSGHFPMTVYAVWEDRRSGSAHILLSRSTDNGATWSVPIRVDDSPEDSQNFFPAVAVSPDTGAVSVVYYTNRVSERLLDVFLAKSTDGGQTFERNVRITSRSFNPNADSSLGTPSTFIGDYIGTAAKGKGSVSVWTDTRTGRQQIFSAISK
ncbi:sialidase family protein [Paenibacillus hamazuiensis]|uniref:sialidase family protein n=1 Tax=Paenibacillus hamazuiensis TaxID=2936508 RepID=UPI00200E367C|nr:sialidase family protein [Paenibacillus hamazuiensis]